MNPYKITLITLFVSIFTFTSCSSDDSNPEENHTSTNYDLLPLNINNSWTYDVSTNDGTNPPTTSTDIITHTANVTINNKEYADFTGTPGFTGIMSTLLDQNNFRAENNKYYMYGDFTIPLSLLGGTDIVININDAVLINQNVGADTELSNIPGSTNQSIGGYDFSINYTLKTIEKETLSSHTVDGQNYSNVVKANIVITATGTLNLGVLNPEILPEQDVYIIENYYADGIGLIDSQATFSYQLIDTSSLGITLPIPATGGNTTTQKITSYTVN